MIWSLAQSPSDQPHHTRNNQSESGHQPTEETDECCDDEDEVSSLCDCVSALERSTDAEVVVMLDIPLPFIDHQSIKNASHGSVRSKA